MAPEEIDDGGPTNPLALVEGDDVSANLLVLPASVERELSTSDESLGVLGKPFDRRTPFFFGLTGALGVAVAYVIARGIGDVTSVLVVIGLALFIAIGL